MGCAVGRRLRRDRQRKSGGSPKGSGQELRQRAERRACRIGEHDPRLVIEPEFAGPGLEAPGRRNDGVAFRRRGHGPGPRARAGASRGRKCEEDGRSQGQSAGLGREDRHAVRVGGRRRRAITRRLDWVAGSADLHASPQSADNNEDRSLKGQPFPSGNRSGLRTASPPHTIPRPPQERRARAHRALSRRCASGAF